VVAGRGETDDLFHCLLDRYHYLGCRGHVGEHIKYMVYDRHKRPLGCLLFGAAAWKVSVRGAVPSAGVITAAKPG